MKKSSISINEFKRLLKELGFTQKQFADFLGLSEQALKRWIKDRDIPYYAELIIRKELELRHYRRSSACLDEILEEHIKNILLKTKS